MAELCLILDARGERKILGVAGSTSKFLSLLSRQKRAQLSQLLSRGRYITIEMAMRLSRALGTSARVWLGMQQSYDLGKAKRERRVDLSRIQSMTLESMHV